MSEAQIVHLSSAQIALPSVVLLAPSFVVLLVSGFGTSHGTERSAGPALFKTFYRANNSTTLIYHAGNRYCMQNVQKDLQARLMEKGWTEEEAHRTHQLFYANQDPQKHVEYVKKSSVLLYWMMLLDLAVCNFIVAFGLVPFLMVLKAAYVELIIFFLGVFMGVFFNMLIWDIEHIGKEHHYLALVFIPVIAIMNMVFMTILSNSFSGLLKTQGHANPVLVSLFYVSGFVAPYGFSVIKYELKKRKEAQSLQNPPPQNPTLGSGRTQQQQYAQQGYAQQGQQPQGYQQYQGYQNR